MIWYVMAEAEGQSIQQRKRMAERENDQLRCDEEETDNSLDTCSHDTSGLTTNIDKEVGVADQVTSCKKPKLELPSDSHANDATGAVYVINCDTDTLVKHIRETDGLNVLYYPKFIKNPNKCFMELETQLDQYYCLSPNIVRVFGKVHEIPRKQTAFGDPGTSYSFSGVTVPANPWIPIVLKLKEAVECAANEKFNFVLVNYYRNGLDHMGEHRDDEKELCPASSIASLSFGAERDFVFCHKDARGKSKARRDISRLKICLSNGSLLLMCQPTNKFWYHSLPVRKTVKGARINLTFRKMKA